MCRGVRYKAGEIGGGLGDGEGERVAVAVEEVRVEMKRVRRENEVGGEGEEVLERE